jgi:hypothetical protein
LVLSDDGFKMVVAPLPDAEAETETETDNKTA